MDDERTAPEMNEPDVETGAPEEVSAAPDAGEAPPPEPPAASEPVPDPVAAAVADLQVRLDRVEGLLGDLGKQFSFLPPQVRGLAGKVENLTISTSEPRLREVLLRLLGVQDLVEQTLCSLQDSAMEVDHPRTYDILRTQLRQVLEANGLSAVPTEGAFDPAIHLAVGRVAVTDPALDGQIVELVRSGYRNDEGVLRYAEVVVGCCDPPATGETSSEPAGEAPA